MSLEEHDAGTRRRGIIVYWLVFGFCFGLYQFGFAVEVPYSSGDVPFGEVWGSANFDRVWNVYLDHELLWIVLAGLAGGALLSVFSTRIERAILLTVVAVIGIAHLDFMMGVMMFLAPVILADQFLGGLDGESYGDGFHQISAMGLFVLFCFGYGARIWWQIWRSELRSKSLMTSSSGR